MIFVKYIVNVQYFLEYNQSTIPIVLNQIKYGSNKLTLESILDR